MMKPILFALLAGVLFWFTIYGSMARKPSEILKTYPENEEAKKKITQAYVTATAIALFVAGGVFYYTKSSYNMGYRMHCSYKFQDEFY